MDLRSSRNDHSCRQRTSVWTWNNSSRSYLQLSTNLCWAFLSGGFDNTQISANVLTLNKTYSRAFRTHYISPHGLTKNKMQVEMGKSTGSFIKVHFNSSGAKTLVRIVPIFKSKSLLEKEVLWIPEKF